MKIWLETHSVKSPSADRSDDQQPTETKLAAATKAKRGKADKRWLGFCSSCQSVISALSGGESLSQHLRSSKC